MATAKKKVPKRMDKIKTELHVFADYSEEQKEMARRTVRRFISDPAELTEMLDVLGIPVVAEPVAA